MAWLSAFVLCSNPYAMLARRCFEIFRVSSAPRSFRTTLPPSGSGSPVSENHHSPRSTTRCKTAFGEGQLAFVDEEPEIDVAVGDAVLDLVERGGDRLEVRLVELEGEVCAGEWPGDRDALALHVCACGGGAAHEARSVAIAHGCTVREEGVSVAEVGVGVNGDRRDLELSAHGALVQRLDVLELVDVLEPFGIDQPVRERVEHERVVGVGAVGDVDPHRRESGIGNRESAQQPPTPSAPAF